MSDMTGPPASTSTGLFTKISYDRASHLIVDQLKTLIRGGRLRPGDRLPGERALTEEFGVSRLTVREALRILESSGLVTIKLGAHGGAFVSTPSTERMSANLADLINASEITATDVTEAREDFELAILPRVVERATEADIDDLLRIVDASDEALARNAYTIEMSAQFHHRLAACTHNPAIEMLVHSFLGPMLTSLEEARSVAPVMGRRGTKQHREIAMAVRARDLEKATHIMRAHLRRAVKHVADNQ
jgi:GntR family transcriptional repressor for pyruvate dehydrogenase complex